MAEAPLTVCRLVWLMPRQLLLLGLHSTPASSGSRKRRLRSTLQWGKQTLRNHVSSGKTGGEGGKGESWVKI
ncbi:hypothetical protein RRG08_033688 [Elysia crispata]|uniref:Secreted protein n=1 Tax=Elysia crispata TaxID=231223 RepID=A0AAE1A9E4_9GAST|nr:hypothetical protein RRG08_033688 [Elysia crispata]